MATPNEPTEQSEQLFQWGHDQAAQNALYFQHLNFLKLMEKQNLSPQMMNLVRMQRCYSEYLFYHSGCSLFNGIEEYHEAEVTEPLGLPDDLLSFSPTLVDILSFVGFKDLINCLLVSRRFYFVISKYARRMPREQAHIHIVKARLDSFEVVVKLRRSYKSDITFFISKDHILWTKEDVQAISCAYKGYNEDMRINTKCVEEGLMAVLEPLLLRFHCNLNIFESSSPDDNIPLEWFTTIAKLAKKCQASCRLLNLPARSHLAVIPSILGRGVKYVTLLSPTDLISRVLCPFFKMNTSLHIDVELTKEAQLECLTQGVKELIEGWQSNEYSIHALHVACYQVVPDEWPDAELGTYLRGLGSRIHLDLIGDHPHLDQNILETSISRPSDGRVLHITHWKCHIKIHDNTTK